MKKYRIKFSVSYNVEAKNENDACDMADKLFEDNIEQDPEDFEHEIIMVKDLEEPKVELTPVAEEDTYPGTIKTLVNKIVSMYNIECLSAVRNIQGTMDIELSRRLMRGDWVKMEKKIRRSIANVNEIFVQEKF